MNEWAVAGGGTPSFIDVTNQQTLADAISTIANAIVPCSYELSEAPRAAGYVRVTLDGVDLSLNGMDGWRLSGTKTVELLGAACESLRDGEGHSLNVQVECEPVIN
jgi:hypothetical protein